MYRPPLFFLRMPDNLSHKMNNCRVPLIRRQLRAALLLFVTISLILPIYLDIMVTHLKLLCLFTQIRFSPWMFLHSVSMRLRKSLSECIVRVEWMSQFTTTLLCTWYLLYTRADARRPIALYAQYLSHFLTLSLKISANQVAMTLFLKISTK